MREAYRMVNNSDIRPAMKLDGNSSTAMWLPHHYGAVILLYGVETQFNSAQPAIFEFL